MLFEHGTLITVDNKRRIIQDGAILVKDGRIAAIGKTYDLRQAFPDEPREDLRGNIVAPGLVDTHVHLAQAMIRGCADDLELLEWLGKRDWVLQGNYDEADGRASAELCIVEMLKSGTTAFLESMIAGRYGLDGIAEAVLQSGMRGVLSKIVMDVATYASKDDWMYPGMQEDRDTSMRQALDAFDKWNGAGDGRLEVWFGPRTPGGVTPELLATFTSAPISSRTFSTSRLPLIAAKCKGPYPPSSRQSNSSGERVRRSRTPPAPSASIRSSSRATASAAGGRAAAALGCSSGGGPSTPAAPSG